MNDEARKNAPDALNDNELDQVSGGIWVFDQLDRALGITRTCTHCNGTGQVDSGEYTSVQTVAPGITVGVPNKVTCPVCFGSGTLPDNTIIM